MEDDFKAHLADQDTEATYLVLQGQLDRYAPGMQEEPDRVLHNDMDELAAFSKNNNNVDFAGRIVWKQDVDYKGMRMATQECARHLILVNIKANLFLMCSDVTQVL